jgi:hypothetical protein
MPNWCQNQVTISGDADLLEQIRTFCQEGESKFSFRKIAPIDPEMERRDWYKAHVVHWGTKWEPGPEAITVLDAEEDLIYVFDTAWAPSLGVTSQLARRFPDATITHYYLEHGSLLCGCYKYREGRQVSMREDEPEYEEDNEYDDYILVGPHYIVKHGTFA